MTAPATMPTFAEQVEARRQRLVASASAELIDARGHPVPPQEVVKRLPKGASIKWIPAAGFYGTAYFALVKDWEPNDPRWRRVQEGECAREDARDIVQMFPRECPPAEMAAYVEHRWGYRNTPSDPKAEADRLVQEAAALYAKAEQDNIDHAVEGSNERSARESRHDLRVRAGADTPTPMVTVAATFDDGPKRLLVKE